MTDRTGQNAIQAIASGGLRETSPAAVGGIKWHPGHGIASPENLSLTSTISSDGDLAAFITEISTMPTIKHLLVRAWWGALETSEGTIKRDLIDQILALCQASGKRLILAVETTAFSAGNADYQVSQGRFPAYLRDQGLLYADLSTRCDCKTWLSTGMDKLIALYQNLAAIYDTHPYFEGINTSELATSKSSPDYTEAGLLAQDMRLVDAAKVAWAHTNVFIAANSAFSDARNQEFMAYMAANRMVFGGPDIRPNDFVSGGAQGTKFQRIYQGLDGGIDYRGTMANGPEVQGVNLGGNHTPTTAVLAATLLLQLIYDKSQDPLNCSYVTWQRKVSGYSTGGTDNDQFWSSAASSYTLNHPTIKEFLTSSIATIPVVTTPPSNYAAYGVDTS